MPSNRSTPRRRNIELKARLPSAEAACRIAQGLATARLGCERQIDTYFHVPRGRLKLRRRDPLPAQLVSYARADQAGPKPSDYLLVEVPDAVALEAALSAALGVLVVVDKRREIFLYDNVRIHVDSVAGLGDFIEFEAVLDPEDDEDRGYSTVEALCRAFGVDPSDRVPCSYSDLVLETPRASG